MTAPHHVDVVGGVGGVEVQYDDLGAASVRLRSAALDLIGTAEAARHVLTDPGLLASGALDPSGFARVEAAVLAAVGGSSGLLPAAARLEEHSLALQAAVLRYEAADRLGAGLHVVRHWVIGAGAVAALPLVPLLATTPLGLAAGLWVVSGDAPGDVDRLLAHHPGLAEDAAGSAPAFLTTLFTAAAGPLLPLVDLGFEQSTGHPFVSTSLESAAGLLGLLYPAGIPSVAARGADTSPEATAPPGGVGDLLAGLEHRDERATGDSQGEIDVRRLSWVQPDGSTVTSWVVDLPGTKQWQFDPRHRDHLNDLATNLTTMAGEPTARVDGVTRALELAGVARDEPVMLVGHSQGGLVAMRAAEQYAADGRFSVTHVVTAGSPTARMAVPASVQVLALENRYDVVPRLDGDPPPPEPNRVTVLFDAQSSDVGRNHAIGATYLPAARAVDDDPDPSLAAWRDSARAFLPPPDVPVEVRTTVWDIRNGC